MPITGTAISDHNSSKRSNYHNGGAVLSENNHFISIQVEETSQSHQDLFGYTVKGFVNEYKNGGFNPGDRNRNRIEDTLEEQVKDSAPGDLVECMVLLSTDDSLFDVSSLENAGAYIMEVSDYIDQIHVRLPVGMLDEVSLLPDVAEVCAIPRLKTYLDSSGNAINMPDVYSIGFTGQGTTIAVLDTGIDGNHEAFQGGKILAFKDYTVWPPQIRSAYDDDGHGTHCASIAAGNPPGGGGSGGRYRGMAYNADLLIARVLGASTYGYVVEAVNWVVSNRNTYNVHVMSLSIGTVNQQGGPIHSDSMNSACNDAVGYGIVVCAAAGNDGEDGLHIGSPGNAPHVVTVGSSNDFGQLSSFSSRGPGISTGAMKPDVLAPGEYIKAARASGTSMGGAGWTNGVVDPTNYIGAQGTSMSCPHVAGVAAILREANSDTSPGDIRNALRESAPNANNPNNDRGCGMIDAKDALDLIGNSPKITAIMVKGGNGIQGHVPDVDEDEVIQFSATATDDKNLLESSFVWDFDNDGNNDATGRTVSTSYPTAKLRNGLKTIKLEVTDVDNFKVTEYCYVRVHNVAPTGNIITSGPLDEGVLIEFTGALSDTASDLDSLKWYWDFDGENDMPYDGINVWSGDHIPDNDRMADGTGTSASGSYTYLESGTTTVLLIVWDDDVDQTNLTSSITIQNRKPNAMIDLGVDMNLDSLYEDDVIEFDASGSTDTENDMNTLEYKWDFGDGEESEWQDDPDGTHSYSQQGYYTVTIRLKDNDGAGDTDSMDIEIKNKRPTAVINEFQDEYFEGDIINLIATNSTDTPGDITSLQYYWDLDTDTDEDNDGIPDNDHDIKGGQEEFPYVNNGTYHISLIVEDNDGVSDITDATIYIKNSQPYDLNLSAVYGGKVQNEAFEVEEGEEVAFLGDATDISGDIDGLNYSWDFGDGGSLAFGKSARHTFLYSSENAFVIQLTVTDDEPDNAAGATFSIYVKNIAPTLELGDDQVLEKNGSIIVEPKITDSPGDLARMWYRWSIVGKDAQPDFNNLDSTDEILSHEFVKDGEYDIYLRIEDDNGAAVMDSIRVVAKNVGTKVKVKPGARPGENPEEEVEKDQGMPAQVGRFLKGVDSWVWLVTGGVLIVLLSFIIVIKVTRRRRYRKNLMKAFKRDDVEEAAQKRRSKQDGKENEENFDYLSNEMGLRSTRKKGTDTGYEELYVEKKPNSRQSMLERELAYDANDLNFFNDVGETEADDLSDLTENMSDLPELDMAHYAAIKEYEAEYELDTEWSDDETNVLPEQDEFWPLLEPAVKKRTKDKKKFDELFALPVTGKSAKSKKHVMKPLSREKKIPLMKPLKEEKSSHKRGKTGGKTAIRALPPMMKPFTEERAGRGKSGGVYHDEKDWMKKMEERPCRVEVILPEDQDECIEETGLELSFKPPARYKRTEKNSPTCKHCKAPVKKGWWMCPNCNKKI
jgi:subtilisin family serine protease